MHTECIAMSCLQIYCFLFVTARQPDQHLRVPHGPGPHPSPQISCLGQRSVTQLLRFFFMGQNRINLIFFLGQKYQIIMRQAGFKDHVIGVGINYFFIFYLLLKNWAEYSQFQYGYEMYKCCNTDLMWFRLINKLFLSFCIFILVQGR